MNNSKQLTSVAVMHKHAVYSGSYVIAMKTAITYVAT